FFVSFCYLNALYRSFKIPWGNVTVSDVLIKGVPILGVVCTLLAYLASEPVFPWHDYVTSLSLGSVKFVRVLIPIAALCVLAAISLGKVRAVLLRRTRKRVDVE